MNKFMRTTISVDAEILRKAREYGINISKATEFCLKRMIEALESSDFPERSSPGEIRTPVWGSKAPHPCPLDDRAETLS
jgi:hypothetical protein